MRNTFKSLRAYKFMPIKAKLKKRLKEYGRVLRITKKPGVEEFKSIAKVTAIGLLLIGLIGFLMHLAAVFIKG